MKTTLYSLIKQNLTHFLSKNIWKSGKVIVYLIISLCCLNNYSQIQKSYPNLHDIPSSCEENEARLDQLLELLLNEKDSKQVLIIISNLGDDENSSDISKHRLHNAKEYILSRNQSVLKSRIIVAEGEKKSGFGQVEFYFGGKIVDKLLVGKNKILCVDCCENNKIKPYKNLQKRKEN